MSSSRFNDAFSRVGLGTTPLPSSEAVPSPVPHSSLFASTTPPGESVVPSSSRFISLIGGGAGSVVSTLSQGAATAVTAKTESEQTAKRKDINATTGLCLHVLDPSGPHLPTTTEQ